MSGGVLTRLAALEHEIRTLRLRVTSDAGGGVPAAPHATSHSDGGSDEVDVTNLAGYPGGSPKTYLDSDGAFTTPDGSGGPHATTHYDGESDEVDVTQLGGYPGGSPVTYLDSNGQFTSPDSGSSSFSGALVKKAANQTGANYTAGVNITFDAEAYDVGGWHDNVTNNTRLTVPSGVSYAVFTASVTISNLAANQWFGLFLLRNGSATGAFDGACAQMQFNEAATGPSISISSSPVPVTAGDYFEVMLLVESDTSIDITGARCMFSALKVG